MNKILNNENGIALIMVIILVVAVGALIGVLIASEVFNISFTSREIDETKAFYLAEAGVQRVEALFNKQGKTIFEDNNSLTSDNDKFINEKDKMSLDTQDGNYKINKIEKLESEEKVEIEILGKYNNAEKRLGITIDLANDIDLDSLFSNALFASGASKLDNEPAVEIIEGASIIGDVKSNITKFSDFRFKGSGKIYGDIFVNINELNNPPKDREIWEKDTIYQYGEEIWYKGMKYIQNNWTKGDKPDKNSTGLYDKWKRVIPKFKYRNDNNKIVENKLKYTPKKEYPEAIFPDFDEVEDPNQISTSKQSDITGRVIDNNNNGLENVELFLNVNNEKVKSQHWGSIGKFTFYSIKGTVTITPVKNGYRFEPESIEVTHPSDEITFNAIPKAGKIYDKNNINTSESLEYKIKGGEKYNEIDIANEVPLVIDMEEGNKTITVNELNINGDIELINAAEDSQLTINVAEKFNLNGSGRLNPSGEINNVTVFYKGENEINIGGGTELKGNIFVEKADLKFTAGSSIEGHVISNGKNVEIRGGTNVTSRVIYAPKADVKLIEGGKVKGSVIANTFKLSGGTKLEYDNNIEIDQDFFEDILDFDNTSADDSSSDNNSEDNSSNDGENKITWYNK